MTRRFPSPWSVEETDACFIVRDATGHALTYVYFEEEPGRRAAAHLMMREEARRIAVNIAKLPELLCKPSMSSRDGMLSSPLMARITDRERNTCRDFVVSKRIIGQGQQFTSIQRLFGW